MAEHQKDRFQTCARPIDDAFALRDHALLLVAANELKREANGAKTLRPWITQTRMEAAHGLVTWQDPEGIGAAQKRRRGCGFEVTMGVLRGKANGASGRRSQSWRGVVVETFRRLKVVPSCAKQSDMPMTVVHDCLSGLLVKTGLFCKAILRSIGKNAFLAVVSGLFDFAHKNYNILKAHTYNVSRRWVWSEFDLPPKVVGPSKTRFCGATQRATYIGRFLARIIGKADYKEYEAVHPFEEIEKNDKKLRHLLDPRLKSHGRSPDNLRTGPVGPSEASASFSAGFAVQQMLQELSV
ncbi:hypothetical protein MMC29_000035 [Sticta canariensis]|nr:hypothetical protein [Sticta canariensis]